jgi:hypothetical protein
MPGRLGFSIDRQEMHNKNSVLQIRLYLIGAFILLAGIVGATFVYLTATESDSDAIGYEIIDGKAYPIQVQDSKLYRYDLEKFGGKAAVLADDFSRWLASLWQGKRLAYLLAVLSTAIALACFLAAHHLSRDQAHDHDG